MDQLKQDIKDYNLHPEWATESEIWFKVIRNFNRTQESTERLDRKVEVSTYKDRKTNIWVREMTKVIDIISNVSQMKWSWAGHINHLKDDRSMDLACHHLETIWQEKTTRETCQAVERRTGQMPERHDMAEDSTRQANLETAC